jgi:hypothetical protein
MLYMLMGLADFSIFTTVAFYFCHLGTSKCFFSLLYLQRLQNASAFGGFIMVSMM